MEIKVRDKFYKPDSIATLMGLLEKDGIPWTEKKFAILPNEVEVDLDEFLSGMYKGKPIHLVPLFFDLLRIIFPPSEEKREEIFKVSDSLAKETMKKLTSLFEEKSYSGVEQLQFIMAMTLSMIQLSLLRAWFASISILERHILLNLELSGKEGEEKKNEPMFN